MSSSSGSKRTHSESAGDKRAKTNATNEQFVTWLKAHGVQWDAAQIDPIAAVAGGVGVKALRAIAVGDVLATIDKAAGTILSPQTCAAAAALKQVGLEGGLAATTALWIEMQHAAHVRGHERRESDFSPYLRWERRAEDVPIRWPAADRALLAGTDVDLLVATDELLLREDFDSEALPALAVATSDAYVASLDKEAEFDNFVAAATLVSSRAFGVDGHHGDCMVPFAALFNHSTTQPHIHVQDAPLADGAGDADGDADDDDEPSSDLETPSRITQLQIVAVRAAAPGDELLNTYGYHLSNRKLLHSYGFCQVRKIDEQLHRATTVKLLRSATEENTDFHFWADIVRIFPNSVVSLAADLVRNAVTEEADQAFLEDMTKAFVMAEVKIPGSDDDDDDEDGEGGNGEDDDESKGVTEMQQFALGLIAPIADEGQDDADNDDDEDFGGPNDFELHAHFVGNALAVGLDFQLVLLLRVLEFGADERKKTVNEGLPVALLDEVDCLGVLGRANDDDDDDDGHHADPHHPSDEHDATYIQLQRAPLIKHCNLGPKARQLLKDVIESRLAMYSSHDTLSADCHALAAALDGAEPALGRREFATMLRVGERALLRLTLARLDLLHQGALQI